MRNLAVLAFGFFISCTPPPSENKLDSLLDPVNLENAELTGVDISSNPETESITLTFPPSDSVAGIVIPVPDQASDWSQVATFSFEATSTSTIRYSVTIHTESGEDFRYTVHPFADVPVRVAIPARFLYHEYMNNRQFKGYWISNWGNHIDLSRVESLAIQMMPNREVTLEIGRFVLAPDEVDDEILVEGPMVDQFGQWLAFDWPGKIFSLEQLRATWSEEEKELESTPDFGFSSYGGWQSRRLRPTGFFRVEEVEGRWWLVDPDGFLFYSAGMDCVRHQSSTRVQDREKLFQVLPPGSGETADFYKANATLRYGEEQFEPNWKNTQSRRLRSWGFNTVANWSDPAMWENPSVPFVVNLSIGRSGKNWHRFPDVYSDDYLSALEQEAAQKCSNFKDEPFLLGYFTGNEERWPHRHFIDLILKDPKPTATQRFVKEFFEKNGDTPASREDLTETLSRDYFRSVCDAIRKADPNHLILGIRWAGGRAPDSVMKANDVFDVFSLNFYSVQPDADRIKHLHELTGRPVIIGEFHFGTVDRGYAPALVMVKDQRERGVAYQYYVEQAAALPALVGTHYFQYVDQPVTGRFDGENYNFGFVSQLDIPYPEMLKFARTTHQRIYQIHAGELEPTERKAAVR